MWSFPGGYRNVWDLPHGFCRVGTPETNWNSTSFEWIDDARLYLACQGNFGYDFACHTDATEFPPSNLFSFITKNSQSLHRACDSHCHHSIHICQIQSYLSNPPIVHSSLPGLQRSHMPCDMWWRLQVAQRCSCCSWHTPGRSLRHHILARRPMPRPTLIQATHSAWQSTMSLRPERAFLSREGLLTWNTVLDVTIILTYTYLSRDALFQYHGTLAPYCKYEQIRKELNIQLRRVGLAYG